MCDRNAVAGVLQVRGQDLFLSVVARKRSDELRRVFPVAELNGIIMAISKFSSIEQVVTKFTETLFVSSTWEESH